MLLQTLFLNKKKFILILVHECPKTNLCGLKVNYLNGFYYPNKEAFDERRQQKGKNEARFHSRLP